MSADESLSTAELHSAALRGLRWTVIARPVTEFVLLGSMVVLARLISPTEFGRYSVALVFAELMLIPAQAVGAALVQRRSASRVYLQAGMAMSLLVGLAIVAITMLAASAIVAPVFDERTATLVRLSTIGCLFNCTNIVPMAVLQRRLAFRRLSALDVVNTTVRAGASIGFAIAFRNAQALVLGGAVSALVGTAVLWTMERPPIPRLRIRPMRELAAYGGPASMAAVSWVGFRNCDYAIVGARLGVLQAGLYFRAYTLGVEYQKKVSQVMSTMGFPLLSRAQTEGEQSDLRSRMVVLLTVVLFPALALLAILAPVVVPWLFGPQWEPAIAPTQILAIGGASTLVIDAVGAVLMAHARTRAMLGFGWGHFLAYAAAVFFISPLGITAVAVAAATVHTLFLLVAYYLMLHQTREGRLRRLGLAARELWRDIGPATVGCVALAVVAIPTSLVASSIHAPVVPYSAAVAVAGCAAYLVALRVFYPASLSSLVTIVRHVLPRWSLRTGRQVPRAAVSRSAS